MQKEMTLHKVLCLDDGTEYYFTSNNGFDAISKMQKYLNISHKDLNSHIDLCNNRIWCLTHNGKVYGCEL